MEESVDPKWRKATYSGNGGSDCVEAGNTGKGTVVIRDTKNRDGVTLRIPADAWARFTSTLKKLSPERQDPLALSLRGGLVLVLMACRTDRHYPSDRDCRDYRPGNCLIRIPDSWLRVLADLRL